MEINIPFQSEETNIKRTIIEIWVIVQRTGVKIILELKKWTWNVIFQVIVTGIGVDVVLFWNGKSLLGTMILNWLTGNWNMIANHEI